LQDLPAGSNGKRFVGVLILSAHPLTYLGGILGKGRATMPEPSFTVMIWLIGMFDSFSTVPLGQVIVNDSIALRFPSPK
jgi:hypothetical protein